MATASFTADTTTIIPNPERGWYLLGAGTTGLFDNTGAWDASLVAIYNLGFRLALSYTTLPTSGVISGASLTQMTTNFATCRARGLKVIIRFQYGSGPNDPALATILSHMNQLAPYLAANKDMIYLVQGGFLGAYGEWADSGSGNNTKAGKRSLKDGLMAMVPPEIPLNFTQLYPPMEDWYSGVLPSIEAGSGSARARSGFHSDCFLTGNGDSFFYTGPSQVADFVISSSRLQQQQYLATATEYVPFGGETCNNSQGASVQQRTGCTDSAIESGPGGILNEGPRFHLSYLNNSFAPNFITAWQNAGCYNTITRQMGHRIQFDSLSHADTAVRGSTLRLTITMRNTGWGRVVSPRRVAVRLINGGTTLTGYSNAQLRDMPSQATGSTIYYVNVTIPVGATTGSYTVHLEMPDCYSNSETLRNFKIQPANITTGGQVWDNTNGRFTTGTTVTVT